MVDVFFALLQEFKSRTENAVKAFSEIKWPVRLDVIKGGAEWPIGVIEEEILIWFQVRTLPLCGIVQVSCV